MGFWVKLLGKYGDDGLKLISKTVSSETAEGVVKTVSKYGSGVITKTTVKVLSWGNAAKVVIVGIFGYVFLSGGLSDLLASSLNITTDQANYLIWVVALIVVLYLFGRVMQHFRVRSRSSRYKGYGRGGRY